MNQYYPGLLIYFCSEAVYLNTNSQNKAVIEQTTQNTNRNQRPGWSIAVLWNFVFYFRV